MSETASQPAASAERRNDPGAAESRRLMSLDALRGFDMFWILGADSFVYALHEMSQTAPTKFLATQLDHAEWAGFSFLRPDFSVVRLHHGRLDGFFAGENHRARRPRRRREARVAARRAAVRRRADLFRRLHESVAGHAVDGRAEPHRALLHVRRAAVYFLQLGA